MGTSVGELGRWVGVGGLGRWVGWVGGSRGNRKPHRGREMRRVLEKRDNRPARVTASLSSPQGVAIYQD